ncbi:hypothetical protein QBC38DRAFT_214994 [Podospora fimiseda]|uniref:Heme oxygenase n=1 Tax=Podospora fimiseda TaxID=252190 RepID=A0AAN7GXY2_9PEZI|nr:hypothetical protein QBC38DRAFT_214994 [Podospora fimiseda]
MENQQPAHHLGDNINIATRTAHTKLNKNLLVRLPLCLPPRACNPTVYLSGILHIAPIYLAFEYAWDAILDSHELNSTSQRGDCGPEPCDPDSLASSPTPSSDLPPSRTLPLFPFGTADPVAKHHRSGACERLHEVLGQLRIEGMRRTENLLADIGAMSGWSEEEVKANVKKAGEGGRLKEFVAHIKRTIDKNPEVLLAYAWVLYMALFSGGRFIRSSLEGAGVEFWSRKSDPVPPLEVACNTPTVSSPSGVGDFPLSFFRFATPRDGEDLKIEFKKRFLACGESLLTQKERDRVVREAICIFDNMNLIVGQLDGVFEGMNRSPTNSLDSWAGLLVPSTTADNTSGVTKSLYRLRDSVAVAKERLGMVGWNKDKIHHANSGYKETAPEGMEGNGTTVHAKGTLTSTVKKQEGSSDENKGGKTGVRVVRFGSDTAVLLDKHGRTSGKSVSVRPEGTTELTQQNHGISGLEMFEKTSSIWDDKVSLTTVESTFWSLILVAAVAGLIWGYGQA